MDKYLDIIHKGIFHLHVLNNRHDFIYHCAPPERKLSTCYFSRIHRPRRHKVFYISTDLKRRTCSDKKLDTYKMFLTKLTLFPRTQALATIKK
jgi:hypothetical protein